MFFPLILIGTSLLAQSIQPGPGTSQPPLHSDLLDQLVGRWDLSGTVLNKPVHERVDAEWVLGHQFLRLHRMQLDGPVETLIHIGYDTVSERYVCIRLDSFNTRGSETIGYGIRDGDKLQFTYEYPSGPFKETWSWDAKERIWQFQAESKVRGNWTSFSTITLRRGLGGGGQGRGRGRGPNQAPPQQ